MTTSRRAILAATASALLPMPAMAVQFDDNQWPKLWAQYVQAAAKQRELHGHFLAARERVEAEMPSCPEGVAPGLHRRDYEALWHSLRQKCGEDVAYDAWNDQCDVVDAIVETIRAEKAEGLFGLGVKLAGVDVEELKDGDQDLEEAILSALESIDDAIGTEFYAEFLKNSQFYEAAS